MYLLKSIVKHLWMRPHWCKAHSGSTWSYAYMWLHLHNAHRSCWFSSSPALGLWLHQASVKPWAPPAQPWPAHHHSGRVQYHTDLDQRSPLPHGNKGTYVYWLAKPCSQALPAFQYVTCRKVGSIESWESLWTRLGWLAGISGITHNLWQKVLVRLCTSVLQILHSWL